MKPVVPTPAEPFLTTHSIAAPPPSLPITNQPIIKRFGPFLSVEVHATDASGQLLTGKLGKELSLEQSHEALRLCLTRCLMALTNTVGDLSAVKRVISVHGIINGTPECCTHTEMLKGTFDLLVSLFSMSGTGVQTMTVVDYLPHDGTASLYMLVEATP